MPLGFSASIYAFFFVELCSKVIFLYPMRDKTTGSCIAAFEALEKFVQLTFPGVMPGRLHPDCTPGWAKTNPTSSLAGPRNVAAFDAWLAARPQLMVTHAPPHTQVLNAAESSMGLAVYRVNIFLHQASLSMAWWEDMLGAAVAIPVSLVCLYSRGKLLRTKSPYELVYKRKPDLPQRAAPPGVGAFVHIEGSNANLGQAKSQKAIPIRPAGALEPSEPGWLVRYRGSGALGVANHMSVSGDIGTRLAMLVKSGTFRLGGRLYGKGQATTDLIRGLFSNTDRSLDELLAVHGPLTNLPIRLVSARDENGELLHDRAPRPLPPRTCRPCGWEWRGGCPRGGGRPCPPA